MLSLYEKILQPKCPIITNSTWNTVGSGYNHIQTINTANLLILLAKKHKVWPRYLIDDIPREPYLPSTLIREEGLLLHEVIALFIAHYQNFINVQEEIIFLYNHIKEIYTKELGRKAMALLNNLIGNLNNFPEIYEGYTRLENNEFLVEVPPIPNRIFAEVPLERPLPLQEEEYDKHYGRTYVKTKKGWALYDKKIKKDIFQIYKLVENELSPQIVAEHSSIEEIDFTPVKNGVYNTAFSTILITKNPNRQWKKGFCKDTYDVVSIPYKVISNVRSNSLFKVPKSSFELVKVGFFTWETHELALAFLSTITDEYYSLDFCVEQLRRGIKISCAIDNKFWVFASPLSTKIILFYKEILIGEIDEKNIINISPIFKQEVIDFINRNNSSFRII